MNHKIKLLDTTVFIDYLRGKPEAKHFILNTLNGNKDTVISVITISELWAGVKNEEDEKRHKVILSNIKKIPVDINIAYLAGKIQHKFIINHDLSVSIADCIIAATAEYLHADIVTRNIKHFQKISMQNAGIIPYKIH